jgi:hypothetical protein
LEDLLVALVLVLVLVPAQVQVQSGLVTEFPRHL